MFKKAIKKALNFVRPLASGYLYYDHKLINNLSTTILLNEDGDLLTTKKVASLFAMQDELRDVFKPILTEIQNTSERKKAKILKKYGIENTTLITVLNILIDIAENPGKVKIISHKYLDLAIIQIENKENTFKSQMPKFYQSKEIGESVCIVGFAFPEYKAFKEQANYELIATNEIMNFPIFPISAMITRNIYDDQNRITMFEMSDGIELGMQGAPIVNTKGEIIGLAVGNKNIGPRKLSYGIDSKTIIEFLKENNIKYEEVKNEK